MEVRKSGSASALNFVETKKEESEQQPVKSTAQGILSVKDSFEPAKKDSSSTTQSQENSGKKQLNAAEEQEASKFNFTGSDPSGKSSSAGTDPQSRINDAKNSGLVDRLGHQKSQDDARTSRLPKGVNVSDLRNSQAQNPEASSDAVNDAQQKLNGGGRNDRQSLEQELAQRRQDYSMLGGLSPMDKAKNSAAANPGDAARGKSEVPTGKDAKSTKTDDVIDTVAKGSLAVAAFAGAVQAAPVAGVAAVFAATLVGTHQLDKLLDNGISDTVNYADSKSDILQDRLNERTIAAAKKKADEKKTKENLLNNGQSVEPSEEHPTGISFDNAKTNNTAKTPDSEHRYGNVPEDIKKSEQYFQDQIRKQKPKTGGETQLTDGGVTGNSTANAGPVNNIFTRLGVQGLVGQPTRAGDDVGNASGFTGSASPIHNGGATDPMEGSNYTGRTIEDDPADVHFGPSEQPKQQSGGKNTESSNSSHSVLDSILKRKTK